MIGDFIDFEKSHWQQKQDRKRIQREIRTDEHLKTLSTISLTYSYLKYEIIIRPITNSLRTIEEKKEEKKETKKSLRTEGKNEKNRKKEERKKKWKNKICF